MNSNIKLKKKVCTGNVEADIVFILTFKIENFKLYAILRKINDKYSYAKVSLNTLFLLHFHKILNF